jgi:hypothetical protein
MPTFPATILIDTREQHPFEFSRIRADAREVERDRVKVKRGGKRKSKEAESAGLPTEQGAESVTAPTTPPPDQFPALLTVRTRTETLRTGDYSLDGYARLMAVERKSKADLYQTISAGRERFERELGRLNEMRFGGVVVVEAEWSELLSDPPPYTQYPPRGVVRSIIAWKRRFPGVQWEFMPGRAMAETWTLRMLDRFWRDVVGGGETERVEPEEDWLQFDLCLDGSHI